jgi:hypothetical protein
VWSLRTLQLVPSWYVFTTPGTFFTLKVKWPQNIYQHQCGAIYWHAPSKSDFPECAGSQWVLITAKACLDYCAHFAIKSHYTEAWLTALIFLSVNSDSDDMSALSGPPQGLIYKQWDCIQFLVPGYPYSKNAFDYPIRNHTLFTITLVCTHVYLKPMFFLVYIITSHPSFGNRNSGVILFVDQCQ